MKPAYSSLINDYALQTQDEAPQKINYNYDIVSGCEFGYGWMITLLKKIHL